MLKRQNRNRHVRLVLERRAELALLACVGFSRKQIVWVVLAEHWLLLFLGLAVGVGAAAVAMWPSLRAPAAQVPYGALGALLGGILAIGLLWTALAARLALRGPLLSALRNE